MFSPSYVKLKNRIKELEEENKSLRTHSGVQVLNLQELKSNKRTNSAQSRQQTGSSKKSKQQSTTKESSINVSNPKATVQSIVTLHKDISDDSKSKDDWNVSNAKKIISNELPTNEGAIHSSIAISNNSSVFECTSQETKQQESIGTRGLFDDDSSRYTFI